jgi:hypothetical protein
MRNRTPLSSQLDLFQDQKPTGRRQLMLRAFISRLCVAIAIASVLLSCRAALAEAAIHLKADRANTKEVALSWTGSTSREGRVERKSGPPVTWSTVATTTEGQAVDSKIESFGTYTYRVTFGTEVSNEITVGPPPSGFHTIAPKPDKHPDTAFGRLISVTLDGNGDPAAGFEYVDPNGDGNNIDSQLLFVAWDRAAYRWKEPVVVATVPNFDPRPPMSCVSLAHDARTGAFGITWVEFGSHGVDLALSLDGGVTWTVKKVLTDIQELAGPTLAFAAGKAHLALQQVSRNNIRYMTGNVEEDPSQWSSSFAPLPPDANGVLRASSLALDSNGAPAIAYWARPIKGKVWTLVLWRPATNQSGKVIDSGTAGYDPDGVLLAFAGLQPRFFIDARLDQSGGPTHLSLFSNDEGATWSRPAPIPDDGNERMSGFMTAAVGPNGSAAFAGDVVGGNTTGMKCAWPKLSRTNDLRSWTTCTPQGGPQSVTRTRWGSVSFAPSGMLYLIFQNRLMTPTQPFPAGLLIWGGK